MQDQQPRALDLNGWVLIKEQQHQPVEKDQYYCVSQAGEQLPLHNSLEFCPEGLQTTRWAVEDLNLSVVKLPKLSAAAAVYTQNACPGDAVLFSRPNSDTGQLQLLTVVSKNANVYTPEGKRDVDLIAAALTQEFAVQPEHMLISMTGVIGVPLPISELQASIPGKAQQLQTDNLMAAARGILTTDRKEKIVSMEIHGVRIAGFAKGAGMIEPNMATMLAYFYTDADIDKSQLAALLKTAVDKSFNAISVDSDTSTSDTVAIFTTASKPLNADQLEDFQRALSACAIKLAREIVGQGEGVSKIIECDVGLAGTAVEAKRYAKKIINSPLVKTAVFGADPNWGRIVMAIGKPEAEQPIPLIDQQQLTIKIMGQTVFAQGRQADFDLAAISAEIREQKTTHIEVQLGNDQANAPQSWARVWGADLTYDYVKINAEYTT